MFFYAYLYTPHYHTPSINATIFKLLRFAIKLNFFLSSQKDIATKSIHRDFRFPLSREHVHREREREREKLYAPLGSGISNFDGIIGRSVDVSTFEGRRRRLVRQLDSRTLTIRDGSMRDFHRESRGFVRRCAKLNRNSNRCSSRGHCVREDSSRSQPNEDKFPVEKTILTKCFLRSMDEKLIAKAWFQQQLSRLSQLSWNLWKYLSSLIFRVIYVFALVKEYMHIQVEFSGYQLIGFID